MFLAQTKPLLLGFAAAGAANALGAYCQWQAYKLSLSKSAFADPLVLAVSITLAVIFLGEGSVWNPRFALGIALCFGALYCFIARPILPRKDASEKTNSKKWIAFAAGFILVGGLANFLVKAFAIKNIALAYFLPGWYWSSFIPTAMMALITRKNPLRLSGRNIKLAGLLSFFVLADMALSFSIQSKAPLSVFSPVSAALISGSLVLIGLFRFKENKGIKDAKKDFRGLVLGLVLGISGTILIVSTQSL